MTKAAEQDRLGQLLADVRSCSLCAEQLENGVRPVIQAGVKATIVIAGQAPGSRVHATGVPFDDPSGERLREWMGIDKTVFYDPHKIAILPMAFCYPGKGKSGDLPPMPLCAATWRKQLLARLPNLKLTLVIGQYAQAWHLASLEKNLTETVRNWSKYGPSILPLPHPSPRNNIWLAKKPWFSDEVIPELHSRVEFALGEFNEHQ